MNSREIAQAVDTALNVLNEQARGLKNNIDLYREFQTSQKVLKKIKSEPTVMRALERVLK